MSNRKCWHVFNKIFLKRMAVVPQWFLYEYRLNEGCVICILIWFNFIQKFVGIHTPNSFNYITIYLYHTYKHTVCVYTYIHVVVYVYTYKAVYVHAYMCMYDMYMMPIYPYTHTCIHVYRYLYACVYVSLLGKHGISVIASVIPMRRTEPIRNTDVIFLLLFVGWHSVFIYTCKAISVARLATFLLSPMTFQIILLFSQQATSVKSSDTFWCC